MLPPLASAAIDLLALEPAAEQPEEASFQWHCWHRTRQPYAGATCSDALVLYKQQGSTALLADALLQPSRHDATRRRRLTPPRSRATENPGRARRALEPRPGRRHR